MSSKAPLYNAANFNWNCCYASGQGDATNCTVYLTENRQLSLPVRCACRNQNINSYCGSEGASTVNYPATGTTTGIFHVYNSNYSCLPSLWPPSPTAPRTRSPLARVSWVITARPIATGVTACRGPLMARDRERNRPTPLAGNNAETNPAAVLQALQNCNAFWSTLHLVRIYHATPPA